jgi:hypothetical protein
MPKLCFPNRELGAMKEKANLLAGDQVRVIIGKITLGRV